MKANIWNVPDFQPLDTLWTHCRKHSKCTQFLIAGYIVVKCCLSPQCTHHVPTGYMGPCLQCINLTVLMFELWCEHDNCQKGDSSRDIWDWAVLKRNVWKTHSEAVAAAASCFPYSFDHTPHNPADKLSGGYKAWELLLYFCGLGPGLFYGILPEAYYKHYCKLVVGIWS